MAKLKLTPERQTDICNNIKIGMTYKGAAMAAGISESAFYSWLAQGEKAKSGRFKEFLEAVTRANGDARKNLVARIHISKDWRAAAHILERRFPSDWGKRDKIETENKTEILIRYENMDK